MVSTVFTDAGQNFVVQLLDGGLVATQADYRIGWGTGGSSTGATATDLATATAIIQEATEVRATTAMTTTGTDTQRWVGTLTMTTAGGLTIENAALMSTATNGEMIVLGTHGGVVLATDDAIQYTIDLQFNDGS